MQTAYRAADFLAGLFGDGARAQSEAAPGRQPPGDPEAAGGPQADAGHGPQGHPHEQPAAVATAANTNWPAAEADFALLLAPDDLPTPFVLRPGVTVVDAVRFLGRLRADVLAGPAGPRARYGAVQADLQRLAEVLTGRPAESSAVVRHDGPGGPAGWRVDG